MNKYEIFILIPNYSHSSLPAFIFGVKEQNRRKYNDHRINLAHSDSKWKTNFLDMT